MSLDLRLMPLVEVVVSGAGSFNLGALGLLRRATEPLVEGEAACWCALIGETTDIVTLLDDRTTNSFETMWKGTKTVISP